MRRCPARLSAHNRSIAARLALLAALPDSMMLASTSGCQGRSVSELASLRQADTLFPPLSPMLGAGQRGAQTECLKALPSPPPGGYLMPPALRQEIHIRDIKFDAIPSRANHPVRPCFLGCRDFCSAGGPFWLQDFAVAGNSSNRLMTVIPAPSKPSMFCRTSMPSSRLTVWPTSFSGCSLPAAIMARTAG